MGPASSAVVAYRQVYADAFGCPVVDHPTAVTVGNTL